MLHVTSPWRLLRFFALLVLVVLLVSLAVLWWWLGRAVVAQSGEFSIAEGAAARAVWAELAANGYTNSVLPWRYWDWRLGAASRIQAGVYQLEGGETVRDTVARFVAGDVSPDELTLTFPEGFTVEQMAARTAARGIGTADEFVAAAAAASYVNSFPFLADIPPGRDLEGYLFPDTYRVFEDDTPADVIARQLANFSVKFTDDLKAEAAVSGRTLDEIVIMASMVEREVISDEDMALVAGILWKRLDDEVGLGADATVRYALKKWDGPLTVQDLDVDSPYNTRRYRGLPPGPISNPGIRALIAAVRPEVSEFYYYLSAPDGETIFSRTLEEHNQNKARYLQ